MYAAAHQTPEIDALLAAARSRLEPPALPPARLSVRVRTSPALRRMVPTRVAVSWARARAERLWEKDPVERDRARQAMAAIVGGTERAEQIDALAREHVVEAKINETLFWQSWTTALLEQGASENLRSCLASPRGVLVSSCHTGPTFLHLAPVFELGRTGYAVAADWWFQEPTPGYWGRRLAHWRQSVVTRNQRQVRADGSFALLSALLARGELVVVYFDMPGSRETSFLGKPVMLSSGSARLAAQTDSLILPVRARRDGARAWTDVHAALDPRDYQTAEELHEALAAVHERWILERPQASEDPNRAGAWEGGARVNGWSRPEAVSA